MMNLKLNDSEGKILAETLDVSLSRLGDEISHTDSRDYRELLKQRRDILEKLRQKLH